MATVRRRERAYSQSTAVTAKRIPTLLDCGSFMTPQVIPSTAEASVTRPLPEGYQRGLPVGRARAVVARVAGEHHAVDHQRVLAWREQLRQSQFGRLAILALSEGVVVRHDPAGR